MWPQAEAKDSGAYNLAKALDKNRSRALEPQCGNRRFVFSRHTPPKRLESLARYGKDIFGLWDVEDPSTDIFLQAALSLARGLCSRARAEQEDQQVDVEQMDRAIRDIEKQIKGLAEISKWGETIRNNSEKILDKARIISNKLSAQIQVLDAAVDSLKKE